MNAKSIALKAGAGLLIALLAYLWFSPAVQQQAPEIKLNTLGGDIENLSQWRGKPVLLTFWATTCPGCVKEMPHLVDLYNTYHAQGLEVLGIAMSYDPPNQVASLVQARKLPYTIALDLDGKAAEAFGNIRLTPTTFLISPEGRIVQKKIGDLDMDFVESSIKKMLNKSET